MTKQTSKRQRPMLWVGLGSVLLLALVLLSPAARAFVRSTFPSGTPAFWSAAQADLNLLLGCPETPLSDFGPCWDDVAKSAAESWNADAEIFRFTTPPPILASPCQDAESLDFVNTVAFQDTLCGTAFGGAVAVTFSRAFSTGELVDTGVVVNGNLTWSAYTGPFEFPFDLRRVLMHEFGHVLGLDHPNESGQTVAAIMNSTVSDLDDLQADDIAGVNAIYPGSPVGELENPQPDSSASGLAIITGWICSASTVTLSIDGVFHTVLYGSSRIDTIPTCGDEFNGFGFPVNWNLVGDGLHTIIVFTDGIEIGRATVTVTTLGQEFLAGASGTFTLSFNGMEVVIEWVESLQNFLITGMQ